MNEILRDRERASIRLVMNPDRMVINEAQRTFTYLNLYGYLTDAVIVNRVFPEEVAGGYFGAWRERQARAARRGPRPASPRCRCSPPATSSEEVVGAAMLDRLGAELFDGAIDPRRRPAHRARPRARARTTARDDAADPDPVRRARRALR